MTEDTLIICYSKISKAWSLQMEMEFLVYELPIFCEKTKYPLSKGYLGYHIASMNRNHFPWTSEENKLLIELSRKYSQNPPKVWNIGQKMKNGRDNEWIVQHYRKNKMKVVFIGRTEEDVSLEKKSSTILN
jgi:hypothetical protein